MDQFTKLKILFCFCQFDRLGRALNALFSVQISSVLQVEEKIHVSPPDVCKNQHFKIVIVQNHCGKLVVNI